MKAVFILLPFVLLSCMWKEKSRLADDEIIRELKQNDGQLKRPEKGDWLYHHKEPGQTFAQYKADRPVRPNEQQRKIYLLPLGKFTRPQEDLVRYTADYLQIFFGLETIVLKAVPDNIIHPSARRDRENGSEQLLAPYILDSILKKSIPADAITVMAVTEKDLYPKPSWGYVFGLASLKERVGVSSIYRYSKQPIDSSNYALPLGRLIKTSSHEIGHMFSVKHCTRAICVMNGSNSLGESDTRPNRLCTECLSKLHWNLGFDVRKRLVALDSFFLRHQLKRDYQITHRDLALIQ